MGENQSYNKIAVVIVNWERPEDTIQCINSVMNSDYPNLEIILVDNGSKDDSLVRFREAYDQINIIELTENEGFTGGYNAGIRKADEGGAVDGRVEDANRRPAVGRRIEPAAAADHAESAPGGFLYPTFHTLFFRL